MRIFSLKYTCRCRQHTILHYINSMFHFAVCSIICVEILISDMRIKVDYNATLYETNEFRSKRIYSSHTSIRIYLSMYAYLRQKAALSNWMCEWVSANKCLHCTHTFSIISVRKIHTKIFTLWKCIQMLTCFKWHINSRTHVYVYVYLFLCICMRYVFIHNSCYNTVNECMNKLYKRTYIQTFIACCKPDYSCFKLNRNAIYVIWNFEMFYLGVAVCSII